MTFKELEKSHLELDRRHEAFKEEMRIALEAITRTQATTTATVERISANLDRLEGHLERLETLIERFIQGSSNGKQ
jgi:hypothetical protein